MGIFYRILSRFKRSHSEASQNQMMPSVTPALNNEVKQDAWYQNGTSNANQASHSRANRLARQLAECRVVNLPDTLHRANIESFVKGFNGRIILKRDTQNKFDRHAIKVMGMWRDDKNLSHIGQIGWLPSDIAFKIATEAPDAQVFADIIHASTAIDIRGPFVQVAIWLRQPII